MPRVHIRRAAIKKYTDAFERETEAFNTVMRSRIGKPDPVLPSGMRYTPYLETESGLPDQIVDAGGENINGPFITQFINTDLTGNALMFDLALKSLTQNGAFISRFQTIKFRQFDEALYAMQTEFLPPSFNESGEWLNVVSNTTYIMENFNSRLNLMNSGLQAIFQSSVFSPNPNLELDYLSNTNWPRSSWTQLPVPLTGETIEFMEETFGGDANVIPLDPFADAFVTVTSFNNKVNFTFPSYAKRELSVTITNNFDTGVQSVSFVRPTNDQPFSMSNDAVVFFTVGGAPTYEFLPNTLSTYSFANLVEPSISGDFQMRLSFADLFDTEITTMSAIFYATIEPPMTALITLENDNSHTQFDFDTTDKSNVLIVSVTNDVPVGISKLQFSRFESGVYTPFSISGPVYFTVDGQTWDETATLSEIANIDLDSATDFVVEMTLSGPIDPTSETMYLISNEQAPEQPVVGAVNLVDLDVTDFTIDTANRSDVFIVSVTNDVGESITSVHFFALRIGNGVKGVYVTLPLSGLTTLTSNGLSQTLNNAESTFSGLSISSATDFVFQMTVPAFFTEPNDTIYISAAGKTETVLATPVVGDVSLFLLDSLTQFTFDTANKTDVFIVSVTNNVGESITSVNFLKAFGDPVNYVSLGISSLTTLTINGISETFDANDAFFRTSISSATDFVFRMTTTEFTEPTDSLYIYAIGNFQQPPPEQPIVGNVTLEQLEFQTQFFIDTVNKTDVLIVSVSNDVGQSLSSLLITREIIVNGNLFTEVLSLTGQTSLTINGNTQLIDSDISNFRSVEIGSSSDFVLQMTVLDILEEPSETMYLYAIGNTPPEPAEDTLGYVNLLYLDSLTEFTIDTANKSNVFIVSVTNEVAGTLTSVNFTRQGDGQQPFALSGISTLLTDGNAQALDNADSNFSNLEISTDFVFKMTVSDEFAEPIETIYITALGTENLPDPMLGQLTLLSENSNTQFSFSTLGRSNVLIVSVSNEVSVTIDTLQFRRFDGVYSPFSISGPILTYGGEVFNENATTSQFNVEIAPYLDFVVEMTLSGAIDPYEETMYLIANEGAEPPATEPINGDVLLMQLETQTQFLIETVDKTNVLIVSVSNEVAESISTVVFAKLVIGDGVQYVPMNLEGATTLTIDGDAQTLDGFFTSQFDSLRIGSNTNFVFEMTVSDTFATPGDTLYLYATAPPPMLGQFTLLTDNSNTEFIVDTADRSNVLVLNVTNQRTEENNIDTVKIRRFVGGVYEPLPLTGSVFLSPNPNPLSAEETYEMTGMGTSEFAFPLIGGIPAGFDFVLQMTVTGAIDPVSETMYFISNESAPPGVPFGPMVGTVGLEDVNEQTIFTFATDNTTDVLIVSVTNGVSESITGINFSTFVGSTYEPFSLTGASTFTIAGEASQAITRDVSQFGNLVIAPLTNFVFEMTLTDPVATPEQIAYVNASGIGPMNAVTTVTNFGEQYAFQYFQPVNNRVLILSVTNNAQGTVGTVSLAQFDGTENSNFAVTGSTTIKYDDQAFVLETATSQFEFLTLEGIPSETDFVVETTLSAGAIFDHTMFILISTVM